jgi:hypothetical protein
MFTNWETAELWIFQHHKQNPACKFVPIPINHFGHLRQNTIGTHLQHMLLHGLYKACQLKCEYTLRVWWQSELLYLIVMQPHESTHHLKLRILYCEPTQMTRIPTLPDRLKAPQALSGMVVHSQDDVETLYPRDAVLLESES